MKLITKANILYASTALFIMFLSGTAIFFLVQSIIYEEIDDLLSEQREMFLREVKDLSYHQAELAEHYVLSFEHFFKNCIHFRAEGYYKKMSNLRNVYSSFRDIDEFYPEARDDLVRLSVDGATSKGIEFLVKYDTGKKLSWWLSYVLAEATDNVSNLQYEGKLVKRTGTIPRAWDQRHTLNIDANYRLSKKWHFNLGFQYRTGWPSTDFTVQRIQRQDGSFAYYHDHGLFRGSRVPSYQRLDVRVNRHFYTSNGKISVFVHVINIYNHENVIRYDHDILEENPETFRAEIGA